MRFEVVSRLSTEKKWLLWNKKKSWKKKKFQRTFVVSPSHYTPFAGEKQRNNDTTKRQEKKIKMSAVKKLIPLMDRVLVERAVAATKTSGGILLPETVGSKVRRMFYSSFARILLLQSSFYEFRFWFIVCLSEKERERESAPDWEDVLFKSWNRGWWWTRFLFFIWWVENSRSVFRVTDDWMMFLSFFLVLLNNYSSTPASSSPSDRGDRVQWTGN